MSNLSHAKAAHTELSLGRKPEQRKTLCKLRAPTDERKAMMPSCSNTCRRTGIQLRGSQYECSPSAVVGRRFCSGEYLDNNILSGASRFSTIILRMSTTDFCCGSGLRLEGLEGLSLNPKP